MARNILDMLSPKRSKKGNSKQQRSKRKKVRFSEDDPCVIPPEDTYLTAEERLSYFYNVDDIRTFRRENFEVAVLYGVHLENNMPWDDDNDENDSIRGIENELRYNASGKTDQTSKNLRAVYMKRVLRKQEELEYEDGYVCPRELSEYCTRYSSDAALEAVEKARSDAVAVGRCRANGNNGSEGGAETTKKSTTTKYEGFSCDTFESSVSQETLPAGDGDGDGAATAEIIEKAGGKGEKGNSSSLGGGARKLWRMGQKVVQPPPFVLSRAG